MLYLLIRVSISDDQRLEFYVLYGDAVINVIGHQCFHHRLVFPYRAPMTISRGNDPLTQALTAIGRQEQSASGSAVRDLDYNPFPVLLICSAAEMELVCPCGRC